MGIDWTIMIGGILAVVLLADRVLRSAIRLAAHFELSGGFLGLTILSIGTSLPEIATHVAASVGILDSPERVHTLSGLVIGANVGSDVFQQNFVLPVVGLVGIVRVVRADLPRKVGALILASVLLWVVCLGGWVSRWEGAGLIVAYLAYLALLAQREPDTQEIADAEPFDRTHGVVGAGAVVVVGFAAIGWVADQVVESATALVATLPFSASLFGVVVLGVATALPELTTAVLSIAKGHQEISAGVLIGSNVTNPLFALGLGAAISGYAAPDVVIAYDLPVKIVTAGLLFVFLWTSTTLSRWEACTLIALFVVYAAARGAIYPNDFPLAAGGGP